ncbi:D-glucuronyl C5-epimerase family protein [Streptomyces boncukensis]|uniref:D-glucuronyl C5-epimerase C-terminal domain-containing protein n=1 Tax=Streptomyces boncukensis TaxID=2711219 RepID=A0A6G4X122_9ACTN|nr:D-glucuronyl C5-epimerase family protein [Streptomyces boncukensis]NGO71249.1 hypothetical protein [Streptomyces boncukensis]
MKRHRRTPGVYLVAGAVLAVTAGSCAAPGGSDGDRSDSGTSVSRERPRVQSDLRFRTDGHRPRTPPVSHRPWRTLAPDAPGRSLAQGVHTVPMFEQDGRLYEHPVRQSSAGLQDLALWRKSGAKGYLQRATASADHLIAKRTRARGAWYFPYTFNYPSSHQFRMRAPWYSAMAQGIALSLFTHLAQEKDVPPGDRKRYRTAADRTFDSLLLGPRADTPWVSHVDDQGYLWLEEYPQWPHTRSDFTFNGHNFAIAGVWTYHHLTGDPRAARLFDGALTTSAHYGAELRRPGGPSAYCHSHDVFNSGYHGVVTRQLLEQYWISGSAAHLRLYRQYVKDHRTPPSQVKDRWFTPPPETPRKAVPAAQEVHTS